MANVLSIILSKVLAALQSPNGMVVNWYKPPLGVANAVFSLSSSIIGTWGVMVQKKDGSWRMCVDYRKLNEKTVKDAYPLTQIDENLDTLEGADWFTSLDLDMAYCPRNDISSCKN
jgi:hypothetical protein